MGLNRTAWRVIVALVVVALAVIAVQLWRSEERSRLAAADAAQAGKRSGTGASHAGGLSIDELLARGNAAPDIQAAIDRTKPRQVAVCGRGSVTIQTDDFLPPNLMAEFEAARAARSQELAHRLTQRSDPLSRLVGLRIQVLVDHGRQREALSSTPCLNEACEQERNRWVPDSFNALVAAAQDTLDARAYRQALFACERAFRPAACANLSWQRFTELAPESVEGWLFLAATRSQAKDFLGVQQAIQRAAAATDARSGLFDFQRAVLPAVEQIPEGFERAATVGSLAGASAAEALPALGLVPQFCSAAAVQDPSRAALCGQLAQRLQDSDTLVYYGLGVRLQQRLARSPEQVKAIETARNALYAALMDATPTGRDDAVTCEGVRKTVRWMQLVNAQGEVGLARAVLAQRRAQAGAGSAVTQ